MEERAEADMMHSINMMWPLEESSHRTGSHFFLLLHSEDRLKKSPFISILVGTSSCRQL